MISRCSCSVKPLRVVVRTLPAEPRAKANRVTASSFGASTILAERHVEAPELDPAILGEPLRRSQAFRGAGLPAVMRIELNDTYRSDPLVD